MSNEGSDQTQGMEPQDDQALWALLGQPSPTLKVSPYFARRVLREATLAGDTRMDGWWGRVRNGWLRATVARRAALGSGLLSGACAALLLTVAHLGRTPSTMGTAITREAAAAPSGAEILTVTTAEAGPADVSLPARESAQDVEVIADLDNALQREESRLWTEDSARF